MNLSASNLLTITLLSSALTLGAVKGNAQQASFHLPVEAHWNSAVLEPGDYRLTSPELGVHSPAFTVRGDGGAVYALPLVADMQPTSKSSYLVLQKVNGSYYVTKYSSGATGKAYLFPLPKEARHQSIANSGTTTIVAVTSAALK
jgi:hypothetical protein